MIAHPIAGYDQDMTRRVLGIPEEYQVITIILVGRRAAEIDPTLTPEKVEAETTRPERLPFEQFVFLNRYGG